MPYSAVCYLFKLHVCIAIQTVLKPTSYVIVGKNNKLSDGARKTSVVLIWHRVWIFKKYFFFSHCHNIWSDLRKSLKSSGRNNKLKKKKRKQIEERNISKWRLWPAVVHYYVCIVYGININRLNYYNIKFKLWTATSRSSTLKTHNMYLIASLQPFNNFALLQIYAISILTNDFKLVLSSAPWLIL